MEIYSRRITGVMPAGTAIAPEYYRTTAIWLHPTKVRGPGPKPGDADGDGAAGAVVNITK
jgi:hypothetical protein